MNIEKSRLITVKNALQYAALYAKTESEAAEFALMCMDVEKAIFIESEIDNFKSNHNKMDCPFNYCDSDPPCIGKCHYSKEIK